MRCFFYPLCVLAPKEHRRREVIGRHKDRVIDISPYTPRRDPDDPSKMLPRKIQFSKYKCHVGFNFGVDPSLELGAFLGEWTETDLKKVRQNIARYLEQEKTRRGLRRRTRKPNVNLTAIYGENGRDA